MATKDDESTPRSPMTECEVLAWFFGKCSRLMQRQSSTPTAGMRKLLAWALWTDTKYVTYRW